MSPAKKDDPQTLHQHACDNEARAKPRLGQQAQRRYRDKPSGDQQREGRDPHGNRPEKSVPR